MSNDSTSSSATSSAATITTAVATITTAAATTTLAATIIATITSSMLYQALIGQKDEVYTPAKIAFLGALTGLAASALLSAYNPEILHNELHNTTTIIVGTIAGGVVACLGKFAFNLLHLCCQPNSASQPQNAGQ